MYRALKDQRRAGRYRAAKMKSMIETKESVVARGFSHYTGQSCAAVSSCCMYSRLEDCRRMSGNASMVGQLRLTYPE